MANDFSNKPSVNDLANRIAGLSADKRALLELEIKKRGTRASGEPTIPRSDSRDSVPLSFAQQRLWFLDQYEPNSSVYNVSGALRFRGKLKIDALQRSIEEIVGRHEALRTTFSMVDGEPVQIVAPAPNLSLPVVDLAERLESEREQEARRLAREEALRPFDLTRGPVFRATLIRLGETDHLLLLALHHIVCDGWSLGVLYRELSALYGAFASGKPAPLEPLPVQYADFAVWQRNWLQGEVLESQLSYWTQQLEGAPAVLNLPTDRPRPALQSFRGRRQSIVLSDELTHRLQALSRREGVTLFMTLLAAFQTLLHRYTGQDDIVVGSPIANRNRTEIEGLIGFFVNTLVLRADLSGNPTFQQLLARVREVALGAYAHQDLPFEKLVDELRPERSLSHSPLFQVMFVLQNAPSRDPEFSGLSLDFMAIGGSTAKFDLLLSMNESAGGLRASLEYSTDLFDAATVQRMLGHFQTLLAEIVARPEQRISDLPILTEAESDQLRVGWNNTEKDFPRDKCVHELFEEQARRSPESVALVLEDQRLTYRELNQRANQLAHYLQDLGVGPEKLVGICVERSPEMVIGLLGILKAGGAYVPLDPGYPRDRLAFMLADTQAPVLITTQRLLEGLPNYEGRIVCLDAEWESISHQTQQEPVSKVTTANLAYAIYTSGSSGKPKAVAMSHRSLCNLLSWQAQNSTHPTPARTLQFASLSFDVSFQEIFATFCSGGTLVLIPEELRRDAVGLLHYLRDQSVERLFLPFVALQQLAETAGHEKTIPESLREIITAGEQLHITAPIISLFNKLKDCKLHNQYGPSESHVVTAFTLTGPSDMWPSRPPIGRPIDNTQIFLLDRYLNPAPIGVSGELCIGGDSLARSYLNRPELTAEKFIPNPFGSKRGVLYRTGDLARYLPDGNIEFLGRTDNQVKVRSFRIELGEIEAVLGQHPAVRETVVTAREDTPGDPSAALSTAKRLVAYVVSNREMAPTSEDLRSFLRQKLPDYMVPSAFVLLDSLPLTPNGKVDRRALPVPDQSRPELEEAFVAARTAVEEVVAGIWGKVLGIGKIGVHDNFFDLGGHSLKATQVMFRLREAYQIDLPLRALFETPTVAGLAARIEGGDSEQQRPQHLPLRAVSREKNLPLSFAQQRLWFWDQLEPDSSIYNIPSAFRLEGVLDIASLQRSINEILRRHEGLRTVFARIEGDPIQRILPFSTLPLPVVDLADRSEGERENEARRLGSEEAGRPFDLTRGPLFRAALLRLGEEEHILLLTMHHIVSDGWSLGVFYRELSVLYEAFSRGQPSPLPDLPIQYPDFAVWQRNWLQGLVLESQLSYWKKQLEDVSVLRLPADRPRPAVQSHRGAKESLIFSHDLSEKLKALSRKEDVTLFMTMLAAFQAFLHRYTGQNDIAVGTPIAGRSGSEIEGLIGFFVNTLVMRADLSGEPTFRELLARVREMALGAYAHQDMPFEKLVEELHPQRNLTQSPLFQVMFSFQNTPRESVRFKGLTVTPIINDSATTKFDLSLSMREEAEGLNGTWRYNVDLFSAATIRRMTEHFRQLVQEILQYPDQPVGELQLISSAERRQLVEVWSGAANADSDETSGHHHPIEERETPARPSSAAEYTKQPLTLTGMIAAWAQRTPDTAAIEAPGRRPLTYHQLLVHIKVVAEKLQEFGIKRSDRVALVLPDGPEAAVAFLAVASVAAGAPLNRAYRFEEFEFYLKHLNARALIVQAGDDSSARAVAQARGIPVLELFPRLDSEAGLFTVVGEREPTAGSTDHAGPGEAALILHTSGTTSQPKLVSLTHANLLASAGHITATLALSRNDRCLNIMPLYHVHGLVGGLLSSLAAGASIVCTPGFSAPEFFGWVDAFRPTWYSAVPTMHQAILARAETNQTTIGRYPLRFIRSSSAALPPTLMEQLETVFQVPIIESYGMTEAAHQISSNPLPPGRRKAGSVGIAAGPEVAIMDHLGNVVPAGTSGEIVIRGANVMQEYDNDRDSTTAAFTRGWFRTGDQGYLDCDGYLFLTGRFKEIINRGGEKISPREVDEVLLNHPTVTEAVTFPVPHPTLGEEVAAAVVLRQPVAITANELRHFAATRLADFKVPRQVLIVNEIAKSPTGKVQRMGLANQLGLTAVDQLNPGNSGIFEPPQPGTEKLLAGIWAQVLGLEHIGRHDNFFQVGGDSLLAAQIMNRVRARLDVRVSFIDFFENPTVAGLAEVIERVKHSGQPPVSPPMRPLPRAATLPLSYAQQALWFLHQLHPSTYGHNRALTLHLTGSLDAGAMQKGLNLIVNRHEALRTSFPMLQDAPLQVIASTQSLLLRAVNLSAMAPPDREAKTKEVLLEEAHRPFDLAQGPVLRAALVKLSDEEHVLIVTFHHIASDGWSDTVFLGELATAYNATTAGMQPDLPALRIQYADFAAWQRETLQGEHVERLIAYWKRQMGTGLPHLKFPIGDLQRAAVTPRQGAHQVLDLPGPLSRALKRLSAKEEVTLFMTLLAGFKTLLYRYTGQEDLLVGTPIAGRNAEELEEVIGNFTNLLGLRTDLSGNPSFHALLDRVRQVTLQAYAHQDLPLGRLAEALRKEMGLDITVPFQVMFGLRNFPSQPPRFTGLQAAEFEFDDGIARFDLSLDIVEKPDGVRCLFAYDTALFDQATMTRLMRHFRTLLEAIVADPDARIDSLLLLDASERHAALSRSVTKGDDIKGPRGIHHIFEEQVARTPAATAVSHDGSGLSYAELNGRANRLAHYLRGLGVGPDILVGICVERSLEMAVGVLGILKAGGAYVPLDPKYPKERLAFLLEDTKVGVVLTQQQLVSALPPRKARLVLLDTDWPKIAREAKQDPAGNSVADNLAYVIYTSGSTGKPKGVLITHGGVVNHSVAMARHFALRPEDRVAQCASLSFDISVEELFPSWISGASLVLCPPAIFSPGTELVRWLDYEQITAVNLPTAFWHEWVCHLERSHESIPRSLRLVVVGGEKASAEALAKWKGCAGTHARWINTYGPTEATVTTTVYEPPPDSMAASTLREIPIGQPITGNQAYILDRHLNPVPIGVVGELCIGGAGLARGYHNHPELTSEKFIANPFSTDPGARLYRTGDLTRYRSDGAIEFIGRIDSQVKIRGFRIEIGEIEAVLSQHPSVHDNVVVVREDEFNDRRLIAYVVLNQGLRPENPDLRGFLLGKMPEYMVPSAFEIIAALPLNANGKIDRRALPAPKGMRPDLKENFVPPRNKTEEQLAHIWSKFLGVKQVGIRDNFFVLGGHSLLAVRLFAEIEKEFKKRLSLSSLFEEATIEHLAGLIKQSGPLTSRSCVVAIQPRGTKPPFFCVHEFFGDVLCYINLARHLGPEQPFYALQARGLDGVEEPFTEIEAMAAYYIEQIRTIQPHGPYGLGGLCSGGIVAFEMAQQLVSQGESVSLLALLDSGVRSGNDKVAGPGFLGRFVRDFPSWLIGSFELTRSQWQGLVKLKLSRARTRLATSFRLSPGSGPDSVSNLIKDMGDLFGFSEQHRKVAFAQRRALRQYQPRIYPGRLTLFRARMQPLLSSHNPDKGWGQLAAGGLDIRVVPSNHLGMLQEPHVRVVAEQLRACLNDAELASEKSSLST